MEEILTELGLTRHVDKFIAEKISPDIVCHLSSYDMNCLGLDRSEMMQLRMKCVSFGNYQLAKKLTKEFDIPKEVLENLLESNFSVKDICNMLSVSESTIYRRLRMYNISKNVFDDIQDEDLDKNISEVTAEFPYCGEVLIHQILLEKGTKGYTLKVNIMAHVGNAVAEIPHSMNLSTLVPIFEKNKLTEVRLCEQLDNTSLKSLGLETIGDCIRFREAIKSFKEKGLALMPEGTAIHQARLLFRPKTFSTRVKTSSRKQNTGRSWTASFLCLADKNTNTIPNGSEKVSLQTCGLGLKKVTLSTTDDETQVQRKLMESFPTLLGVGGFELLKCMADKRSLEVIRCSWNVENLKAVNSQQSKIYIRPIQKNLSITDVSGRVESLPENKIQEMCLQCGQLMNVTKLRSHLITCSARVSDDDVAFEPLYVPAPQHQESRGSSTREVENSGSRADSLNFQQHQGSNFPEVDDSNSTPAHLEDSDMELPDIEPQDKESGIAEIVEKVVNICSQWSNPVEILKKLQSCLLRGRKLEVDDITNTEEGETNHICVDRQNILETAFDEIKNIKDLRITLEVDFYGESVSDLGGPRKEFFRLVMMAIKEKYFDHDLRSLLAEDYVTIGKIFGLSILQNGSLPTFIPHGILNELFSDEKSSSPCIQKLRMGLDMLGIYQIGNRVPAFVFLLRPASRKLTVRALTHYLKPKFADNGSNSRILAGVVYAAFMRYIREVASGRRGGVALFHILEFVTGASEEPAVGYSIAPSIEFVVVNTSFIPTANTCSCCMYLPRPAATVSLLGDEQLFTLYDYAFQNTVRYLSAARFG